MHLCNAKKLNMLRIQLHIEVMNWSSPKCDFANCGACIIAE